MNVRVYAHDEAHAELIAGDRPVTLDEHSYTYGGLLPFLVEVDDDDDLLDDAPFAVTVGLDDADTIDGDLDLDICVDLDLDPLGRLITAGAATLAGIAALAAFAAAYKATR